MKLLKSKKQEAIKICPMLNIECLKEGCGLHHDDFATCGVHLIITCML